MPNFAVWTVVKILDERADLQRVELSDNSVAYVLKNVIGRVREGDAVVVNTLAVDLDLGTGGQHVVHWILGSEGSQEQHSGRIIKARYLSEQCELDPVLSSRTDLAGARVLFCVLHSHVAAIAASVRLPNFAYLMTDQSALPMALSDLVAELRDAGLLGITATAGQAFGGEVEAVNVPSGVAALLDKGYSQIVIAGGPGHLGTNSILGFSALDIASHAATLSALGADVALCVRASETDPRPRHNGVSHHVQTILRATATPLNVPIPVGEPSDWILELGHRPHQTKPLDVSGFVDNLPSVLESMGRPLSEDAVSCAYIGSAAHWLVGEA